MKRLGIKKKLEYIEDLKIIKDFIENKGFEITLEQANDLWIEFSDTYNAQFLNIDEELLNQFAEWLDK